MIAAAGVLAAAAIEIDVACAFSSLGGSPTPPRRATTPAHIPGRRFFRGRRSPAVVVSPRATVLGADATDGLHGSNFCFLPLDQLDSEHCWPRVLRVAGTYPGLTAADLAAAPATIPPASKGAWTYEFPDAHGTEYGLVAVPGSDLVQYARDPVVVIASSAALGLPLREDTEVLLVVDRAERSFSDRAFFAFADATTGALVVRRFDAAPPADAFSVAGRVVYVNLPYDPATQAPSGTWLEEGDVSM